MNVTIFAGLCCSLLICVLDHSYAAKLRNKGGQTKPADEDTYGELVDHDIDVQNDEYDYPDENEEVPVEINNLDDDLEAKILTKPEIKAASIGDVVTLPCQVSNKDPVMVWKHNNAILFQGGVPLTVHQNINYTENGSLQISIMSRDDFGDYTCSMLISETRHPEVVHKIVANTPPQITYLGTESNKTVLSAGETLTLTCRATGYPKPSISWHKSNERLGTTGESLTIEDVSFQNTGVYRCLADNKLGEPAHKHIEIFVQHSPIISVEKFLVNSDHGSDAELKCTVKSYPAPYVNWQKDGQNIAENLPKIKLTRHHNNVENILTIKNLEATDFGVYNCVAANALGKATQNISLVKTPAVGDFQKPQKDSKDVTLTWNVESKSPVSNHELQYRKKGETTWKTVKPEVMKGDTDDIYVIKHTLKDAETGQYETRVRSQNAHGWSDYTDVAKFEKAKHSHHKQHHNTKKEHKKDEKKEPQTLETPEEQQHSHSSRTPTEGASTLGGNSSSSLTASILWLCLLTISSILLCTKQ